MSIQDLFKKLGRQGRANAENSAMDIVEFIESPFGLGMGPDSPVQLYPVQRTIIKSFYNLELDDVERNIKVPKNWRYAQSAKPEHYYEFTEAEYLAYLFDQGRCNISELDHDRRALILPIGRRSGKSFISSIIGAYETYRLLRKGNPQGYYGLQEGAEITLSTVAPTKDQSQILYNAIRNHFVNCSFFEPYMSHDTQSFVRFQTPHDIDETGDPNDGGRASYQIRFFSSSSSGIRGHANIVIILDEVAFFKDKGGSSAQAVYNAVWPSLATFAPQNPEVGQSSLSRESEGRGILISSPYAKSGLFYNQYSKAKSGGPASKNMLMIQAPTWEVNPTVPVGYLENFHADDPVVFTTEFGAEFTDRVSSWIEREKDFMVCVDPHLRAEVKGRPRQSHYLGLDLAVVNDRTSIVLTRPEGDRIKMVYHEEWQAGFDWWELNPHLRAPLVPYARELPSVEVLDFDELANWIREISRRFYIQEGIFDQWQGLSFQQTLDKMNLGQITSKQFTRDETSLMFDAFKTLMYHGKLWLYDYVLREIEEQKDTENSVLTGQGSIKHAPYITEMLELRAERKSKKVVSVQAPQTPGKHDDFADALVRSVWLSVNASGRETHIAGRRGNQQGAQSYSNVPGSATEYRRRKRRLNNYGNKRGDRLDLIRMMNRRRR